MHELQADEPLAAPKYPGGQDSHVLFVKSLLNFPLGHLSQVLLLRDVPSGHSEKEGSEEGSEEGCIDG